MRLYEKHLVPTPLERRLSHCRTKLIHCVHSIGISTYTCIFSPSRPVQRRTITRQTDDIDRAGLHNATPCPRGSVNSVSCSYFLRKARTDPVPSHITHLHHSLKEDHVAYPVTALSIAQRYKRDALQVRRYDSTLYNPSPFVASFRILFCYRDLFGTYLL